MNNKAFESHPLASLYEQKAEQANQERYDGMLTDEQHIELRAIFGIDIEESHALARYAEHKVWAEEQQENTQESHNE